MNVHISYKVSKTAELEHLINQQVEKLGKYLRIFRPDLVHLKGIIEENSPREGFVVSLNLRLPSGQMAARESSPQAIAAVKASFDALTDQVKKHKDLLRNTHTWRHRRGSSRELVNAVPLEQTFAGVKMEKVSASDVSGYLDANLPRLSRYVERQLRYRESQGQLVFEQVSVEDVISEAIANALSEQHDQPEKIKLEPWLYKLANQAIDRLSAPSGDGYTIPVERSTEKQQFRNTLRARQKDAFLYDENAIGDADSDNPEELAARSELISLVENTLREAGRNELETFILYTVEGFTLEEIADITGLNVSQVRESIANARERLRQSLPVRDRLKDKLMEYSESA
jgi:RNA polymerase sigma factor (sigma-70 family)